MATIPLRPQPRFLARRLLALVLVGVAQPGAACLAWAQDGLSAQDAILAQAIARDEAAGAAGERIRERRLKTLSKASRSSLAKLHRELGSFRPETRFGAFEDLSLLAENQRAALIENLSGRNGYQRRWSLLLLAEQDLDEDAAKALIALFGNLAPTELDRFHVLGALAAAAPNFAVELFKAQLLNPDPALALAAQVGLERAEGARALASALQNSGAEKGRIDDALRRLAGRCALEWKDHGLPLDSYPEKPPAPVRLRRQLGLNYELLTDLDSDEKLKRAELVQLLAFRRAFAHWLEPARKGDWQSRLRIFRDRGEFERYGACHEPQFYAFEEFYYSGTLRELVGFFEPDAALRKRRLQHELAHDVLEHRFGIVPPWLAEGLCELVEVNELEGPISDELLARPSINQTWLGILREQRSALPSLSQLMKLSPTEFYGERSALNYAASWSLIAALARSPEGLGLIRNLLERARRDGPGFPDLAFRGDLSLEAIEKRWKSYTEAILR